MVTDRIVIVSNSRKALELTKKPLWFNSIEGGDRVEAKVVTSQGYAQVGETLVNTYVVSRDLTLKGQIQAETTYQMQTIRNDLLYLFVPQDEITINHYYGGQRRILKAVVTKSPKFKFTDVSTVQEYEVKLEAPDPYWTDETESVHNIADYIGDFHFPLSIPEEGVIFGYKNPVLIATIHNDSPVKIGMEIAFIAHGTLKNPMLFDVKTRKFIQINTTMVDGDEIRIKTGEDRSIIRNRLGVTENFMGYIDIAGGGYTFLELEPGDNLLRYGAQEGESMLEVKIYYKKRYPGV